MLGTCVAPPDVTTTDIVHLLTECQLGKVKNLNLPCTILLLDESKLLVECILINLENAVAIRIEGYKTCALCRKKAYANIGVGKAAREIAEFQSQEPSFAPYVRDGILACQLRKCTSYFIPCDGNTAL